MLNIIQDDITDADTDPSERSALATRLEYGLGKFAITEGMELMAYNQRRPDGGEARSVDTVDMVPCVTHIARDESSDTSGTDTAVINGSDIEDFCHGRSK